jgi:catechol 2,3-dioxygenase-like lactoylglutathione lyase family enzyme
MIGYVMLGTNDPARARAFYEPLLAQIGFRVNKTYTDDRRTWFRGESGPMLVLTAPYDEKAATHGNGTMVALAAPSPEVIRKVHADALAAGASDEGAPRDHGGGFYGAYFRDHDGNKICVFKMG